MTVHSCLREGCPSIGGNCGKIQEKRLEIDKSGPAGWGMGAKFLPTPEPIGATVATPATPYARSTAYCR